MKLSQRFLAPLALVLLSMTALAPTALALEPASTLRLSILRVAGDCRLKLHGAPPNARVTLVCLFEDQVGELDNLRCDGSGRCDVSIASLPVLNSIPRDGRTLRIAALVPQLSAALSNELPLAFSPRAVSVASRGDDGKSVIQWFDSISWQEIGKRLPIDGVAERMVYTPDRNRFFVLTDSARGHVVCFDGVTHQELGRWVEGELGVNIADLLVSSDGLRLLVLSRGRSDRFPRISLGRLSIMDVASLQVQEPGVPVMLAQGQRARIVEDDESSWRVFVLQANMQIAQINLFQRYREDLVNVERVADDVMQEEARDLLVLNRTLFAATAGHSSSGEVVGALSWFEKGTRAHGHIWLPSAPLRMLTGTGPDGRPAIFVLLEQEAAVLVVDPVTKTEVGRFAIPAGAQQMALSEEPHLGMLLYPHGNDGSAESELRFFDATALELWNEKLPLGSLALDQPPLVISAHGNAVILIPDQGAGRVIELESRTARTDLPLVGRPTTATER